MLPAPIPRERQCSPTAPIVLGGQDRPYVRAKQEERLCSQLRNGSETSNLQQDCPDSLSHAAGNLLPHLLKPLIASQEPIPLAAPHLRGWDLWQEQQYPLSMRKNQPFIPRAQTGSWLSLRPMGLLAMSGAVNFLALFPWRGLGRRVLCFLQASSICIPLGRCQTHAGAHWSLAVYLACSGCGLGLQFTPVTTAPRALSPPSLVQDVGYIIPRRHQFPIPCGHAGLPHSHNLSSHLYLKGVEDKFMRLHEKLSLPLLVSTAHS